MLQTRITKKTFDFLKALEKNNNRDWFAEHKTEFKARETEVKGVFSALRERLEEHDDIERTKVFRIYRDVRFSHDKTPYKTHFGGSFSRLGAHLRGGYYLQVKPGDSFMATGFWNPNKEDLLRIRKEFEQDASEMREIIGDPEFKKVWGSLQGDSVKTAPRVLTRTTKTSI